MNKIKLAMCDDIVELCEYFKSVFEIEDDVDFVGMAHNASQCLELVKESTPDVILLDVQMESNDSGIELIPQIKKVSPQTKIIILTIHEEDEYILRAFTLGAIDYITKTSPEENILASIRAVYENTLLLRPEIAQKILSECEKVKLRQTSMLYTLNLMTKLSSAEFEILKSLYDGYSYRELAKSRFVEELTIRSQAARILKKFNSKNMKTLINQLRETKVFDIFNN